MTDSAQPRLLDYLGHILQAIERIPRYTAELDKAGLERAEQTQDALIGNFEIIGEASAISNDAIRTSPRNKATCLRDWLTRRATRSPTAYLKVDPGLVWETIHADPPDFAERVRALRDGLGRSTE
jgi:uncharacterized protein with HEPN domain